MWQTIDAETKLKQTTGNLDISLEIDAADFLNKGSDINFYNRSSNTKVQSGNHRGL